MLVQEFSVSDVILSIEVMTLVEVMTVVVRRKHKVCSSHPFSSNQVVANCTIRIPKKIVIYLKKKSI